MQRLVVSTDDVAERDRFSYWREAVGETIGVTYERNDDRDIPFEASIDAALGRSLRRYRFHGRPHPAFRRERDIARHSWDDRIGIYREIGGGSCLRQGRRELVTRPGDLIIIGDPTIPFDTDARLSYDHELWSFPRALFDPHLAATQRPRSLHLSEPSGLNGLVLDYLDALGRQLDSLGDDEASIADNFCRLLAVACGGAAGEQRGAIASARLEEAKRHIGLNLADPALTPEKAAAALKLSVRQLHRLFEPSGMSFAQYLLSRRIEECRSALTSPMGAHRSVTDIAFAWGFNSLPTFYRAFQREFGQAPNELRAAATTGEGL